MVKSSKHIDYISSGRARAAYHLGLAIERRDNWMCQARIAGDKQSRTRRVLFARSANHTVVRHMRALRELATQ